MRIEIRMHFEVEIWIHYIIMKRLKNQQTLV